MNSNTREDLKAFIVAVEAIVRWSYAPEYEKRKVSETAEQLKHQLDKDETIV